MDINHKLFANKILLYKMYFLINLKVKIDLGYDKIVDVQKAFKIFFKFTIVL